MLLDDYVVKNNFDERLMLMFCYTKIQVIWVKKNTFTAFFSNAGQKAWYRLYLPGIGLSLHGRRKKTQNQQEKAWSDPWSLLMFPLFSSWKFSRIFNFVRKHILQFSKAKRASTRSNGIYKKNKTKQNKPMRNKNYFKRWHGCEFQKCFEI